MSGSTAPHPQRIDRITIGLLPLGSLVLYILTICPTVFWYDSAEYATAAFTLGIPHPPGYPLYTLIGRLFIFLPIEPALSINLMSACFGALAVALAWIVIRKLGAGRLAALVGAGTLATGQVFWNQALIAEVYTPAIFFLLVVVLLLLRGIEEQQDRYLLLAAGLAGLGLGVHLFIATCGVGMALLVLGSGLSIKHPKELRAIFGRQDLGRRLKIAGGCLVATMAGACIFLYIPLRASMNPELNFQDPSNWERFSWFVTGGNYKGWFLQNYPLLPRLKDVLAIFYEQFLVFGLALSAIGLAFLMVRQALLGLSLLLMIAGNVYFFFNYRVHDLEVFFLPAITLCCLLIGLGAQALLNGIERLREGQLGRHLQRPVAVVMLLFPLSLGVANYSTVDHSGYTAARDFGNTLCAQLPPKATILNFTTPPEWKNDAVFSYYFQKVLRKRRDVQVRYPYSPRELIKQLLVGKKIYLYYPVPQVTKTFQVIKEGALYRIVKPL